MSKERPFKTYKGPQERPFKAYNPPPSTSRLFQEGPTNDQPLCLASPLLPQSTQPLPSMFAPDQDARAGVFPEIDFLTASQRHRVQQQQQQQQPPPQQPPPPHQDTNVLQSSLLGMDPSLQQYYEDLNLDDPDNALLRPEMMVPSEAILQRERDLNIPNLNPSFLVPLPGRPSVRGQGSTPVSSSATSMTDMSLMFDQSSTSLSQYNSSLQQQQQQQQQQHQQQQQQQLNLLSKSMGVNSFMSPQNLLMPATSPSPLNNGREDLTGLSSNCPASSGVISSTTTSTSCSSLSSADHFLIKQEADEGKSTLPSASPTSSSIHSPPASVTSEDGKDSVSSPPARALKRSASESSSVTSPGGDASSKPENGDKPCPGQASDHNKDPSYLEKRRKNNESAKRSREARRSKEELVALRVVALEEENMKLTAELNLLAKELDELRNRVFSV